MAGPAEAAHLQASGGGRMVLSGALTFATAASLWKQTDALLQAGPRVEVDLASVTRADSAGLALLVGWLGRARAAGVDLRYAALPERLLALARISEVDALLSGAAAQA